MRFKFVQYRKYSYPNGIEPALVEVAGHIDKKSIKVNMAYSLHTEYSYGKRKFSSPLLEKYPELRESNKKGIPQLWKNTEWAKQFAEFVIELTTSFVAPTVIEIHPPFDDYCNLDQFFEHYLVFEELIHKTYPDAEIVIENRAGSRYSGGKFIISNAAEIANACKRILDTNTKLGVVLDFPQLLTAESISADAFDQDKYFSAIDTIYPYQSIIKGIHVWGKKKNVKGRWVAHNGTLDTFIENTSDKDAFIYGIQKICSDGKSRFFVPEVNSGEDDLKAIVNDVLK